MQKNNISVIKNFIIIVMVLLTASFFLGISKVNAKCYEKNGAYSSNGSGTLVDDYYCRVNACAIASTKAGKGKKFTYYVNGSETGARGCGDCGNDYSWDSTNNRCDLSDYAKKLNEAYACSKSAKNSSECSKCDGYIWYNNSCVAKNSVKDKEIAGNKNYTPTSYDNYDPNQKANCGNGTLKGIPKSIPKVISVLYTLLQIAIPVVLVITGSLDLFKGITAQKEDEIKKGQQMLVKRLITAVIVFFVFVIVRIVVSIAAESNSDGIIGCAECFIKNKCD